MSEHMMPIPSRIYNAAVGGHVAGSDQIIDDETGLTLDKVAGGALEEKTYTSGSDNGMGRVVLRKNLVEGVNTLTQSMINKSNTVYVIQYDFTLGEDITVPADCVLEFDGGSISGNATLTGTNTFVEGRAKFINITFGGTFKQSTIIVLDTHTDVATFNGAFPGMVIKTRGYSEVGDGGETYFNINTTVPWYSAIAMPNGLYAHRAEESVHNVRTYGAREGIDCTGAFQAACIQNRDGYVYVPQGTYRIDGTVTVQEPYSINIVGTGYGSQIVPTTTAFGYSGSSRFFNIRDISFANGNNALTFGYSAGAGNIHVERCYFNNVTTPILLQKEIGNFYVNYCHFIGCVGGIITNMEDYVHMSDFHISNCHFQQYTGDKIIYLKGTLFTIDDCVLQTMYVPTACNIIDIRYSNHVTIKNIWSENSNTQTIERNPYLIWLQNSSNVEIDNLHTAFSFTAVVHHEYCKNVTIGKITHNVDRGSENSQLLIECNGRESPDANIVLTEPLTDNRIFDYPNGFNYQAIPRTAIPYTIPQNGSVSINLGNSIVRRNSGPMAIEIYSRKTDIYDKGESILLSTHALGQSGTINGNAWTYNGYNGFTLTITNSGGDTYGDYILYVQAMG